MLGLFYFSVLGPLQSFELSLPGVDVRNGLIEIILDVRVISVHDLDLLEGFVVLRLHVGVDFRRFLLVLFQFDGLLLYKLLEFVVLFLESVPVKSTFSEFFYLNFIAVPV